MSHVLGIDVSTTATKAVLVDRTGAVAGIGVAEYGFDAPQATWSEQDPALWWDAAIDAVHDVLASTRVDPASIEAIGLTGQMHGLVLLDDADRVLRRAILWNDQRTAHACDEIREAVGAARLVQLTGNDAVTGLTAPKLVWVRDHEPEVWGRAAHVLLPKDYLRLRLTGEHALDKADGAGTLLFDLAARDWSEEVLARAANPARVAAADIRRPRGHRADHPERRRGHGTPRRHARRRGRRRPGGERCRRRSSIRGDRRAVARNVGRYLRGDHLRAARSPGPRACVLPRGPRSLAPDVGDALGRREPALVP